MFKRVMRIGARFFQGREGGYGRQNFPVAVVFCLLGALPAWAQGAGENRLWEALTYLKAVPEIAWVEIEDRTVVLGWRGYPAKFARIHQTAARNASRQAGGDIQVYSVKAQQRGWRPEKKNDAPLCHTTARDGRLIFNNCR